MLHGLDCSRRKSLRQRSITNTLLIIVLPARFQYLVRLKHQVFREKKCYRCRETRHLLLCLISINTRRDGVYEDNA